MGVDAPRPAPTYVMAAAALREKGQVDHDALKDFQEWCTETCAPDEDLEPSYGRDSSNDGESDWDRTALDCAAATRRRGAPRMPLRGRDAGRDARWEKEPARRPCYNPFADSLQVGEKEELLAPPSTPGNAQMTNYACVARPVTKAEAANNEKAR